MKKLLILSVLIFSSYFAFAQSGNTKMMEMLKKMQNNNGKIMLVIEGKTFSEKSSFFQTPKGKFVLSTNMATATNTFAIVLPKKESGNYPFSTDKKEATTFVTRSGMYEVKSGTIRLINSGGKISGTFTGKAQKFIGKSGNQKPQGDLIPFSGSFSGLTE
ncbi:hypothetical protein SAMN04487898_10497 [Pedobacter sp. ok626]|uniref:hypothetical protein n=1 Tax=Pedobacter sp. ok626 TaxID=1761882 RepID=UPI00088E2471|nr:hypothetical protein [Pedobacter sp. ok626]SDJ72355.1 hypothetical protein SAMN04487898_10497 [Pedobacter sp. ok626]